MSKEKEILFTVDSEEKWKKLLEHSDSRLVVLDCYQDWCGSCEAMQPILQRFLADVEDANKRVLLAGIPMNNNTSLVQSVLTAENNVNLSKQGCVPLFLLVRSKVCVAVIQGVDAPTLIQHIQNSMPDKPAEVSPVE